jgi:hypothetical protein
VPSRDVRLTGARSIRLCRAIRQTIDTDMDAALAPVATISHSALRAFLGQQPWPFWAVDTPDFAPLVPFQPVTLTRLVRVLKSHYIFSDLYVFNPASTEAQVACVDWSAIPAIDAHAVAAYVIGHAAGEPFLGLAGSLDTAQCGEIFLLIPAHQEQPH